MYYYYYKIIFPFFRIIKKMKYICYDSYCKLNRPHVIITVCVLILLHLNLYILVNDKANCSNFYTNIKNNDTFV